MPAAPAQAVLFDFNGTLSDDETVLLRVYTELFAAELGWELTPERYFTEFAGISDREIVARAVGGDDPGLVARLLRLRQDRYQELVAARCPVRPAARRLVETLADEGRRLGIVTGALRGDVELVLRLAGVAKRFEVLVAEEDVTRGKPDPEGYLLAARLLGCPAGSIAVLEDSVAGVRAARAAGMRCIAVEGTAAPDRLAAEGARVVPELGPDVSRLL